MKILKPNVCPICLCVHCTNDAVAVGRFNQTAPAGYTARHGGPVRVTREEAEADECRRRVVSRQQPTAIPAPLHLGKPSDTAQEQPRTIVQRAPFPAADMEQAAREKAWLDFLTHVAISLTVWKVDASIHNSIEPVFDWLERCKTGIDEILASQ